MADNYSGPERRQDSAVLMQYLNERFNNMDVNIKNVQSDVKNIQGILNGANGLVTRVEVLTNKDKVVEQSEGRWFKIIGTGVILVGLVITLIQAGQSLGAI